MQDVSVTYSVNGLVQHCTYQTNRLGPSSEFNAELHASLCTDHRCHPHQLQVQEAIWPRSTGPVLNAAQPEPAVTDGQVPKQVGADPASKPRPARRS
jgi:hypothetical protein